MNVVYFILLLLAAICFLAGAYGRSFGRPERPLNLLSLGLLFWVLVPLIVEVRTLN